MRLPATLLSQLRATIAVSAVLATGCDLAGALQSDRASDAEAADPADPGAQDEPTAQATLTPVPEAAPAPARKGIAGAVARAVETSRQPAAVPETEDDPTTFVPFEAEPGSRVRPTETESAPLAFADPPPRKRVTIHHKKPKPVVTKPKWECPACGRG